MYDDAVSWYERNASTGALTYGGVLKDGVDGVDGLSTAFGVDLSPDGNHAYVTGYFDNAVSWYGEKREHGSVDIWRDVEGRRMEWTAWMVPGV